MKHDEVEEYQRSDDKPDKCYSILPTVLELAAARDKRVLDVGCGSGFFSRHLVWQRAERVFGLDIDPQQIRRAKTQPLPRLHYQVGDMFTADLPSVDIITAPFVLNYASDEMQLRGLLRRLYGALEKGGRLVAVVDLPSGQDLKRFGAVKQLFGEAIDGTPIQIDIFNGDQWICCLPWSIYYWKQETLERVLRTVGYRSIEWHQPVVSEEGIKRYGPTFWEGYIEKSELGYLTAER